jgi:hypothetical protein
MKASLEGVKMFSNEFDDALEALLTKELERMMAEFVCGEIDNCMYINGRVLNDKTAEQMRHVVEVFEKRLPDGMGARVAMVLVYHYIKSGEIDVEEHKEGFRLYIDGLSADLP